LFLHGVGVSRFYFLPPPPPGSVVVLGANAPAGYSLRLSSPPNQRSNPKAVSHPIYFSKISYMSPTLVKEKRQRLKEKISRIKNKKQLSPEEIAELLEDILEYSDTVEESIEKDNLKPISYTLERHDEKIKEVETSLRDLIDIVRTEIHSEIISLRKEMDARFEALQREMDARFEAIEKRISFLQWVIVFLVGIPSWGMILLNLAHFFK